ncbi:MAG TPA: serine hydrolase, partial [Opitutus sp.]|nr:serine hydrolase [Opitutus sp.]
AVNQGLFRADVTYDGIADIAYVAIASANGRFGGLRCANTEFSASNGITGVYAPGVQFMGPVYIGDVDAFDFATPALVIGSAMDRTIVAGGDLQQTNSQAVKVSGLTRLEFVNGATSHSVALPAQGNKGQLEPNGIDVTSQVVVNP